MSFEFIGCAPHDLILDWENDHEEVRTRRVQRVDISALFHSERVQLPSFIEKGGRARPNAGRARCISQRKFSPVNKSGRAGHLLLYQCLRSHSLQVANDRPRAPAYICIQNTNFMHLHIARCVSMCRLA